MDFFSSDVSLVVFCFLNQILCNMVFYLVCGFFFSHFDKGRRRLLLFYLALF